MSDVKPPDKNLECPYHMKSFENINFPPQYLSSLFFPTVLSGDWLCTYDISAHLTSVCVLCGWRCTQGGDQVVTCYPDPEREWPLHCVKFIASRRTFISGAKISTFVDIFGPGWEGSWHIFHPMSLEEGFWSHREILEKASRHHTGGVPLCTGVSSLLSRMYQPRWQE